MAQVMYVEISKNGRVFDTEKGGRKPIHLGVKYIDRKHSVQFYESNGEIRVSRVFDGKITLFDLPLERGKAYLISTYVEEVKKWTSLHRRLYGALKDHFDGVFQLSTDDQIKEPFKIILETWLDVTFNYRFKVQINPEMFTTKNINEILSMLATVERVDLYTLQSYYNKDQMKIVINESSAAIIKSMQSLQRAI